MRTDLLLTGGRVHTVDAPRTTAEAVAVADGRIAAVGTALALAELAGPETRVVELGGRMAGPYAVSAHTHAILVGFVMMMILGVALWLFPRPSKEDTRYTPRAA